MEGFNIVSELLPPREKIGKQKSNYMYGLQLTETVKRWMSYMSSPTLNKENKSKFKKYKSNNRKSLEIIGTSS